MGKSLIGMPCFFYEFPQPPDSRPTMHARARAARRPYGWLRAAAAPARQEREKRRVHGSPIGGTTGVSLEQGLGLIDISRGRLGRRPGDERSSPRAKSLGEEIQHYRHSRYLKTLARTKNYFAKYCQALVPRSTWIGTRPLVEKQDHTSATCVFLFLDALPRHLENSFGF